MSKLRNALNLAFSLAVITVHAQEIRLGALEGNEQYFTSAGGMTIIDWSRPANAAGSVNTASVAWHGAEVPCDGIFYVRFYAIPSNALVALMTAERGPFRAENGINTVALDPPVAVTRDTYIGIRRTAGGDGCGQPYGAATREPGRALIGPDTFTFGPLTGLSPLANFRLQALASSTPSVRVSTIPVVGAVAGANNSFFRTALTLSNPSPDPIHGKLVFHPVADEGTADGPSADYEIPAHGTLNYGDIIASMAQSGLGSLDIYTTGSAAPVATARVFNDVAAGTSGLTEDAVPATNSYRRTANVFIPTDLTNFRLNVGLRTFAAASLIVELYNAAGAKQSVEVRSYAANHFEHVAVADFLGDGPVPAGGKIVVYTNDSDDFIFYGSVTDNRTNDPNLRIGSD
jgi:hypothetical protein